MNINEIDFKNLHKQSKAIQLSIALLIGISVVVLGYFYAFSDQIDEYNAATEKEIQLKESFEQKSTLAANLNNLKEELVLIEESIATLLKQLPTDAQIPNLIQEMYQAATKNGLTMSEVTPQKPVDEGQIQKLPFSISLSGSHEQLANFAQDIGKMSRIVTLSNLSIKNADSKNNGNQFTLSALANTYKATDPQSQDADVPSTAQ